MKREELEYLGTGKVLLFFSEKTFISHQWWKQNLESLNIETLLLIIKWVGKRYPPCVAWSARRWKIIERLFFGQSFFNYLFN